MKLIKRFFRWLKPSTGSAEAGMSEAQGKHAKVGLKWKW